MRKGQKEISLLRQSWGAISKKVQIRKPAAMEVFVPMFNLVEKLVRVQKYFQVGKYLITPYWYEIYLNSNVYTRKSSCKCKTWLDTPD